MEIVSIPVPGGHTRNSAGPWIEVVGKTDENVDLIVKFCIRITPDIHKVFGEIKFTTVFEYRFMWSDYQYDDFPELGRYDPTIKYSGLLEIVDSPYIENMLSHFEKRYSGRPRGKRLGRAIPESKLKHFRLTFDEYGVFNVLSLGVSVREYVE